MNLAVIIDSAPSPYSGVFKAAINWTRALNADFIMLNDANVSEYLKKEGIIYHLVNDINQIPSILQKYEFVFYDDRSERLLRILSTVPVTKLLYAYPVRGLRPMGGLSIRNYQSTYTKTIVRMSRLIPYRLILRDYIKYLKKADIIITQSFTSSGLMRYYLGVVPDAVLFNPVDRVLFRSVPYVKKVYNKVLLFLGNSVGDADIGLLIRLDDFFSSGDYDLYVFGYKGALKYMKKTNCKVLDNIPDKDLAYHMATSAYTLIIQEDEPLSYVSMESICSGTPVLACYPEESIKFGVTGYYSSKMNYIKMLKFALNNRINSDSNLFTEAALEFDMNTVADKLQAILNKILDRRFP